MKNFNKYLALVLFILVCVGGFSGRPLAQDDLNLEEGALPSDEFFTSWPASKTASRSAVEESAAGAELEVGQETSETRTIDVIGRGTIYRDDVAAARDVAVADALQGVVEQAVCFVISSVSVVRDFQLLGDRVYNKTETFINGYKVLTESKSGRYYRVVVRATVSMSAIKEKLQSIGILVMRTGMPTVMFFLSEQNIDSPYPKCWWGQSSPGTNPPVIEEIFAEYMRDKNFIVIDRTALSRDIQIGLEYLEPELSDDAAVRLGKEFGADLVIVGKAVASYSGNVLDKSLKSMQAKLSARAIRTDSGMAIASSQGNRVVVHSDDRTGGTEALILSASVVAQDLVRQIIANWRKEARQSVIVGLVVKGIREYADFVRFRKHLRSEVRGVRSVYLRSIKAGEAEMDVDVMGNARILANELMLHHFEGLAINIFEVSKEVVRLELIPAANNG